MRTLFDFYSDAYTPKCRYKDWEKTEDSYIKRYNVAGHTKESLSITLIEDDIIKITSIKDKIPTYAPSVNIETYLPDIYVEKINAAVENGILSLVIKTKEPRQIEIT